MEWKNENWDAVIKFSASDPSSNTNPVMEQDETGRIVSVVWAINTPYRCRDCFAPLNSQEAETIVTMCGDKENPCPVCGYYDGIEEDM